MPPLPTLQPPQHASNHPPQTSGFPIFCSTYLPPLSISPSLSSLIAYGGGGGSSKTGIKNAIHLCSIETGKVVHVVDTGDGICTALCSYAHVSGNDDDRGVYLVTGVGIEVTIYKLACSSTVTNSESSSVYTLQKVASITHGINTYGLNSVALTKINQAEFLLATGGEDGRVILTVITIPSNDNVNDGGVYISKRLSDLDAHSGNGKPVSSLSFTATPTPSSNAQRNAANIDGDDSAITLVSSGKDSTVHIYQINTYTSTTSLLQSIHYPTPTPKNSVVSNSKGGYVRPAPVNNLIVKNTACGRDGRMLVVCTCGRFGSTYLTAYIYSDSDSGYGDGSGGYREVGREKVLKGVVSCMSFFNTASSPRGQNGQNGGDGEGGGGGESVVCAFGTVEGEVFTYAITQTPTSNDNDNGKSDGKSKSKVEYNQVKPPSSLFSLFSIANILQPQSVKNGILHVHDLPITSISVNPAIDIDIATDVVGGKGKGRGSGVDFVSTSADSMVCFLSLSLSANDDNQSGGSGSGSASKGSSNSSRSRSGGGFKRVLLILLITLMMLVGLVVYGNLTKESESESGSDECISKYMTKQTDADADLKKMISCIVKDVKSRGVEKNVNDVFRIVEGLVKGFEGVVKGVINSISKEKLMSNESGSGSGGARDGYF